MQTWPSWVQAAADTAIGLTREHPQIIAIAVVGSWARNAGRHDSDVDLVVLAREPNTLLTDNSWFAYFDPEARLIRQADFGALQERRLQLTSGQEVEVAIGTPSWAAINPLDQGTKSVISDGMVILYDPTGALADATAAATLQAGT